MDVESPYNQIQQAVRYVLKIYLVVLLFIKRMWRKKRFLAVNWMILYSTETAVYTTLRSNIMVLGIFCIREFPLE